MAGLRRTVMALVTCVVFAACGGSQASTTTSSDVTSTSEGSATTATEVEATSTSEATTTSALEALEAIVGGPTLDPPLLANIWVFAPEYSDIGQNRGLQVTYQEINSSPNTHAGLLANQIDVGIAEMATFLTVSAENPGHGIRVVGSGAVDIPQALIVREDRITSLEDIQTARVGITQLGTIAQFETIAILQASGLDASAVEWVPLNSPLNRDSSLIDGSTDATVMQPDRFARLLPEAEQRGVSLKVLLTPDEIRQLAPLGGVTLLASEGALQNPELVQRWVDTIIDGNRLLFDSFEEYVSLAEELQPGQNTEEQLRPLYDVLRPIMGINGGLSAGVYERMYQTYWSGVVNPEAAASFTWEDAQQFIDHSFVDDYLARNGVIDDPDTVDVVGDAP